MQALVVREHAGTVFDRAALGIGRGVIEPGDAGMGDRARTHCARLKCDPQLAAVEAFVAQNVRGGANRQDLGVRGRIVSPSRGVVRGGDHRAVPDHHRADRHFACHSGGVRLIERGAHG